MQVICSLEPSILYQTSDSFYSCFLNKVFHKNPVPALNCWFYCIGCTLILDTPFYHDLVCITVESFDFIECTPLREVVG